MNEKNKFIKVKKLYVKFFKKLSYHHSHHSNMKRPLFGLQLSCGIKSYLGNFSKNYVLNGTDFENLDRRNQEELNQVTPVADLCQSLRLIHLAGKTLSSKFRTRRE